MSIYRVQKRAGETYFSIRRVQVFPTVFPHGSEGEVRHGEMSPQSRRNLQLGCVSLWRARVLGSCSWRFFYLQFCCISQSGGACLPQSPRNIQLGCASLCVSQLLGSGVLASRAGLLVSRRAVKPSAGWCFAVVGRTPWQVFPAAFLEGSESDARHREAPWQLFSSAFLSRRFDLLGIVLNCF